MSTIRRGGENNNDGTIPKEAKSEPSSSLPVLPPSLNRTSFFKVITIAVPVVMTGSFSLAALGMLSSTTISTGVVESLRATIVTAIPGDSTYFRRAQGKAVKCKPAGDCDGPFTYVPRLYAEPATKSHEEVSQCVASYSSKGPEERSRYNEDVILYNNFFRSSSFNGSGFFLEVGAYDGMREAHTRLFEECLGWKVSISWLCHEFQSSR